MERVCERAEKIEDGAPAELLADRGCMASTRVENGSEEEGVAGRRVYLGKRCGGDGVDLRGSRRDAGEEVRRA